MSDVKKELVLVMDINSIPDFQDISIKEVIEMYRNQKIILYNSDTGDKPEIIKIDEDSQIEIRFKDVAKE